MHAVLCDSEDACIVFSRECALLSYLQAQSHHLSLSELAIQDAAMTHEQPVLVGLSMVSSPGFDSYRACVRHLSHAVH